MGKAMAGLGVLHLGNEAVAKVIEAAGGTAEIAKGAAGIVVGAVVGAVFGGAAGAARVFIGGLAGAAGGIIVGFLHRRFTRLYTHRE